MVDALKNFRREIEYCAYCPKLCRFSCPVAQVTCTETATPTGKMTILKLVRDGVLPLDREAAELFYLCTGCLVSRTYCEHEIAVYPPYEAARRLAVEKGVAPEKAQSLAQTWAKRGNPFEEDLGKIVARVVPEKSRGNRAGTVLFTGCATLHYFPEQIADTARVLAAAGVPFRVFEAESLCCGQPLLALGHGDPFLKQAEKVARGLADADLVLTPCPTCAHFLKDRYREFGLGLKAEVKHVTEFLAGKIEKLPIRKRETRKTVYHDPCHLGRYLNVYREPREVLTACLGEAPLEFFESKERSTCCGGGGGLPAVRPSVARAISQAKAATIRERGGEIVATACPMCRRMLGRSGREFGVTAEDVVTILARAMGES